MSVRHYISEITKGGERSQVFTLYGTEGEDINELLSLDENKKLLSILDHLKDKGTDVRWYETFIKYKRVK